MWRKFELEGRADKWQRVKSFFRGGYKWFKINCGNDYITLHILKATESIP